MKKVAIINYKGGNGKSVYNALSQLSCQPFISADVQEIQRADAIVIPGVGAAAHAMKDLVNRGLDKVVTESSVPVLGICLGMQLFGRKSDEGNVALLQQLPQDIVGFPLGSITPHMGWNSVRHNNHYLFANIPNDTHFYFVHSYFMNCGEATIATAYYEVQFAAAVAFQNYFGTQFHPEKSGAAGMQLLTNFIQTI